MGWVESAASDPTHPLNFMVHVKGDAYIPVSVTAVVAFGFVSSSLLINANPWVASHGGAWDTPAEAISESSIGGRAILLVYRLYVFLHMAFITATMLQSRGLLTLCFYTNWTYILEMLYFLLAAVASALALRKQPSGTVRYLGATVVTLFHVALTAALVVDILHWVVLWPILSKTPDPKILLHHRTQTFSWISYNTHVLNAVFILGELLMNNIPFHPYLVGYGGMYSSFYGLWSFSFYKTTGRWIYPFLNASKPWAPYVYLGIYLGHWAFFGTTAVLFKLRDKLLGNRLAVPEPKPVKVD